MKGSDDISRRKILCVLGTGAIGAASLGSQPVLAGGQAQTNEAKKYLHEFDPSDPEEVTKAVGYLRSIETRAKAEKILFNLSSNRQDILIQAIKDSKGIEVESEEEVLDQTSDVRLPDRITLTSTERVYHCKGVLKNSLGTTEGVFDHYVRWSYDGNSISNFSHWKRVKAPGWLTYWNTVTTDYIDDRGDHGVSKMGGDFRACVTNYGCYLSKTIESGIWVYSNGDAACNAWNQVG